MTPFLHESHRWNEAHEDNQARNICYLVCLVSVLYMAGQIIRYFVGG